MAAFTRLAATQALEDQNLQSTFGWCLGTIDYALTLTKGDLSVSYAFSNLNTDATSYPVVGQVYLEKVMGQGLIKYKHVLEPQPAWLGIVQLTPLNYQICAFNQLPSTTCADSLQQALDAITSSVMGIANSINGFGN